MSRQNIEDLRERVSRAYHRLRGMVRRVTISLTGNTGQWQAQGYRGIGVDDIEGEKFDLVEVFPGIGISARPKAGSRAEAIIVHVGAESGHPVIVATRDRSMEVSLEEDETAVFNSQAVLILKKDGTVEIRSRTGVAQKLVTWADFTNHTHVTAATGPAVAPTKLAPAGPFGPTDGTQKLKAE